MRAQTNAIVGALVVLAGPFLAQDSVSLIPASLPGDAVSPYDTGEQLNTYIVDLTRFSTSWGTEFGIAPLAKTSRGVGATSTFANNGMTAQATSAVLLNNQPFPFSSYDLWTTAGGGVNNNPAINSPGTPVMVGGSNSTQFAVAFDEFGATDTPGVFNDNIVTAVVNYLPNRPSRLYVARVGAAQNGPNGTESNASVAIGGVDEQGAVHFRADGFGALGTAQLFNNNWIRVNSLQRTFSSRNEIDSSGTGSDAAATDWLLFEDATTHNTETIIPCSIAGRPLMVGTNFNSEFVHEQVFGALVPTMAHLSTAADHRGGMCYNKNSVVPGGIGTGAMLGQDGLGLSRGFLLFGLDFDGTPLSSAFFVLPAAVTDNADGHVSDVSGESIHHRSQTAFQGGNGQVAMNRDQNGNFLVALTMEADPNYNGAGPGVSENPRNAIVVARISPTGALQGYTTAAYVDATARKAILDGNGNAIGQLAELQDLTGGAPAMNPVGPSMSSPAMDAAGNVWFIGTVELFNRIDMDMDGIPESSDFDNAVLRAVYDPASFSYKLELVVELGQVFRGRNSDRNYQISFIPIADGNSVSSATMFSGNINQCSWNNVSLNGIAPRSALSLGGLVFNCSITYDVDQDGTFDDLNGAGVDQQYTALMYIGRVKPSKKNLRRPLGGSAVGSP